MRILSVRLALSITGRSSEEKMVPDTLVEKSAAKVLGVFLG